MTAEDVAWILGLIRLQVHTEPDSDAFDHSNHFVAVIDTNEGRRFTACLIEIGKG